MSSKNKTSATFVNGKGSKKPDTNGTGCPSTNMTAAAASTRKRKRSSPFRIKVGCVVALRFRPELNNSPVSVVVTEQRPESPSNNGEAAATTPRQRSVAITWDDNWAFVWTNPLPGRDEGLALIGKRIRCFFPKEAAAADQNDGGGASPARRVLEGEIIRMVDYGTAGQQEQSKRNVPRSMQVELLVDDAQYQHFSYLPRSDLDIVPGDGASEKARRNFRLEERIRGTNKVCVVVRLMQPWWMESRSEIGIKSGKGLRWVVQKLVPLKLFHGVRQQHQSLSQLVRPPAVGLDASSGGATAISPAATGANGSAVKPPATTGDGDGPGSKKRKSMGMDSSSSVKKRRKTQTGISKNTRHVGDGNDTAEQQMSNWRWFASRFHDSLLSAQTSELDAFSAETLSGGFVAEVIKVESLPSDDSSDSTLAVVTLQRMFLPEQTASGRLSGHHDVCIFNDHDNREISNVNPGILLKVPIEHLVVVSRKVDQVPMQFSFESLPPIGDDVVPTLVVSHSYSLQRDAYFPSREKSHSSGNREQLPASANNSKYCHRCRQMIDQRVEENGNGMHRSDDDPADDDLWLCSACEKAAQFVIPPDAEEDEFNDGQACDIQCDCIECRQLRAQLDERLLGQPSSYQDAQADSETLVGVARRALDSSPVVDFALPLDFWTPGSWPTTAAKPITKVKQVTAKKDPRSAKKETKKAAKKRIDLNGEKKGTTHSAKGKTGVEDVPPRQKGEDYSVFKPTCARLLTYEPTKKCFSAAGEALSSLSEDKPRNLRETVVETLITEMDRDEKAMSGRAARANQRRMMKDVASFSTTANLTIDTLASREPQLRFDRSGIHAWGVYADEDLAAGEMIVEYRGVLIGNTIAEKLEKEYEAAKIGSDYMFRVDALTVCDATKEGNVARFINASCQPNCFTKVITLDGNKRIVIYAKRDIKAGEELCYDYKFPLEYDESKRIPCRCGAKECRGYMNWDKRYVALEGEAPEDSVVAASESSAAARGDRPLPEPSTTTRVGAYASKSSAPKKLAGTKEPSSSATHYRG